MFSSHQVEVRPKSSRLHGHKSRFRRRKHNINMARRRKNRTHLKGPAKGETEVSWRDSPRLRWWLTGIGEGSKIFRCQGAPPVACPPKTSSSPIVWSSHEEYIISREGCQKSHGAQHGHASSSKLSLSHGHLRTSELTEQERPNARMRDYLMIAPSLNVTHLLAFTLTDAANVHMRVARLPQGPTLTFRVQRYSLVRCVMES
jgi:hypothetical protein